MQESATGAWTLGIIMGLLAVLGLIMASGAVDPIFHATGLAFSAFGIFFIFVLIKHNTR